MIPAKHQTLKINSNTQSLRLVERLVEDVCEIYGVNDDSFGNMMISVTEAVNNAILHGNKNDPEKFVKIGFESDESRYIFSVTDEGEGFDHLALPNPTDPSNVGKLTGRGVFLMKNLSDFIQFELEGRRVLLGFNA
jgi:serine/threonine-protein kinase RsbW